MKHLRGIRFMTEMNWQMNIIQLKITNTPIFIILIIIIFSFSNDSLPHEANNKNDVFLWSTIGIGISPNISKEYAGPAAGFVLSGQFDQNICSVRALGATEFYMVGPSPYEHVYDISLLYGRCCKSDMFFLSLETGLSKVGGLNRGVKIIHEGAEGDVYERRYFNTIGLPFAMQTFIMTPYIGFGAYVFANVNNKNSYAGFLICFQIGKIQ